MKLKTLKDISNKERKDKEKFKIIKAYFQDNDESFLVLKVSLGDWIYDGVLDLNKKGQEDILEAKKKEVAFFNREIYDKLKEIKK
jgi:hypothetical protein